MILIFNKVGLIFSLCLNNIYDRKWGSISTGKRKGKESAGYVRGKRERGGMYWIGVEMQGMEEP